MTGSAPYRALKFVLAPKKERKKKKGKRKLWVTVKQCRDTWALSQLVRFLMNKMIYYEKRNSRRVPCSLNWPASEQSFWSLVFGSDRLLHTAPCGCTGTLPVVHAYRVSGFLLTRYWSVHSLLLSIPWIHTVCFYTSPYVILPASRSWYCRPRRPHLVDEDVHRESLGLVLHIRPRM